MVSPKICCKNSVTFNLDLTMLSNEDEYDDDVQIVQDAHYFFHSVDIFLQTSMHIFLHYRRHSLIGNLRFNSNINKWCIHVIRKIKTGRFIKCI